MTRPVGVGPVLAGLLALVLLAVPLLWRHRLARAYDATLLLLDLPSIIEGGATRARPEASVPGPPAGPTRPADRAPTRVPVAYAVDGRAHRGDLYLPAVAPRAGIVLLHGAHPLGKDEPRLVAFATALARARFAVLAPDVASLRAREVRPTAARDVADGVSYLASRPDLAPGGRVGIGTFSFGAGPAMLAALDPALRGRVRFLLAVGGYYDLAGVFVFMTTGYYRVDGAWRYREPSPDLRWLLLNSERTALASAADRQTLGAIAGRRLADPEAPVDDLVTRLGPEGRALYAFVDNRDPHRAAELMARLPAPVRANLEALTLANKDLTAFGGRLILIHGRDDTVIPYAQSLALARAVPPGRASLFVLERFAHIEKAPRWLDAWRMWRAADALLAERDGEGAPGRAGAQPPAGASPAARR